MPLLRRQPFVKQKAPPDLKPDEEVFHCPLTGEIFRDYEKFFERIILCNSLVWTCELTGHPGLTYQEALESEAKARKQVSSIPTALRKPLLYLATLTHRSRLQDLNEDIFSFMRDRYFIGEVVEVQYNGDRKQCVVAKVMAPGDKNASGSAPGSVADTDSDVVCLDDPQPAKSPKQQKSPDAKSAATSGDSKTQCNWLDPDLYEYVVQEVRKSNIYIIKAEHISRKKGMYTRDKSKLYMKQHCDASNTGIWKVKGRYIRKFKLNEVKFEDFFDGPAPAFVQSVVKKRPAGKATSSVIDLTEEDEAIKKAKNEMKMKKKAEKEAAKVEKKRKKDKKEEIKAMEAAIENKKLSIEERNVLKEKIKQEKMAERMLKKEEMKKKWEEEKLKRKEERDKDREKRKEEKKARDEYLKEWSKPREDMECDDLKALPVATPIQCHIPRELFGDVIMVLEYLHCFDTLFDLEDQFPKGISFCDFDKALVETDVSGLYSDLLRLLIITIFQLQEEEEEEEEGEGDQLPKVKDADLEQQRTMSFKELVKAATVASQSPHAKFCMSLRKLPLDKFTLTEILRLHFLSSGAEGNARNVQFRYQQRGGYTGMDDAGLEFRREEPHLLKMLSETNVFDLEPVDKLKVLKALTHQVMTFVASRDWIEDNFDKLRQIQNDLRHHRWAEQRREKDETTFWYRKRLEERAKERELEAQRKKKKVPTATLR